jgi:pimeloyl-ACP methyl ester carboxylesterase
MARTREVGTLWIGGALSWMEILCLKSFVDAGQKITLFSYEDIPNVPEGVIRRDGREIIDTDNFMKYEKKDSFALFADLFRLHMIKACPGMIWIDTDVYCHKPMTYESDYVFGFELPDSKRVNNAILGMPADCALLKAMIAFTDDHYAIPEFIKPKLQEEYRAAKSRGEPVHVSAQPWGVWGPMMVTYFVHKLGLLDKVQPMEAFYPVPFPDRTRMIRKAEKVEALFTEATTAVHLWASNKRELGLRFNGVPRAGSYLDKILAKHGIAPLDAPIKSRGRLVFEADPAQDAAVLEQTGVTDIGVLADLGGTAPQLAIAAHNRFDCDIVLIDLTPEGAWPDTESDWVAGYRAHLAAAGIDASRVKYVARAQDLRPVDLLLNVSGFGDVNKVKYLEPVLTAALHADSRMVLDIRKGSGAFPFLRGFGSTEILSEREDGGGGKITRAVFTPAPPPEEDAAEEGSWGEIARGLAGAEGFYRAGTAGHSFLYMPRSKKTLVVTFDNLDIAMNKREDRRPWGFSFIEKQGWSMLGVLAGGWTWYREPWVAQEFDRLRDDGFFDQFERVVFYGASMGGYAAAAFSAACPGADVVIISPQSTLDKTIVPWETRYKVAWDRDFSGPYGDAAEASRTARRVSILYDPYEPLDSGHVARFNGANVVKLRTPLLGHRLGSSLHQMGILTPIILGALDGTLTQSSFYQRLRARRTFPRYQRELFKRAVDRGHFKLAKAYGKQVLTQGDNRAIRLELAKL